MGFGLAQVHAQKGWRHQEKRQFISFDQLRVLRCFERIGISDNSHAFDERIPERDGRSESMKKRKGREDGVGLSRVQQLSELRDISDDITVADDNALWFSSGSTRKQQDCFSVAAFLWNLQKAQEQTCRNQDRNDPPKNDLTFHARDELFQLQNAFGPRKVFKAFHELRC